jgi:hypothetical protein
MRGLMIFFGVGCRKMYPKWLLEQFETKMDLKRHSLGCSCTTTHCTKVQVVVTVDLFDA